MYASLCLFSSSKDVGQAFSAGKFWGHIPVTLTFVGACACVYARYTDRPPTLSVRMASARL